MPATKTKNYTLDEKEVALFGRAYAHPARVKILNLLGENQKIRNCDLAKVLNLNKATVHDHLKKLEDANLIRTEFYMNSFYISKNEQVVPRLVRYVL